MKSIRINSCIITIFIFTLYLTGCEPPPASPGDAIDNDNFTVKMSAKKFLVTDGTN